MFIGVNKRLSSLPTFCSPTTVSMLLSHEIFWVKVAKQLNCFELTRSCSFLVTTLSPKTSQRHHFTSGNLVYFLRRIFFRHAHFHIHFYYKVLGSWLQYHVVTMLNCGNILLECLLIRPQNSSSKVGQQFRYLLGKLSKKISAHSLEVVMLPELKFFLLKVTRKLRL